MKANLFCNWDLSVPTEFGGLVNIYVDRPAGTPKIPGEYDVLYLCEPHLLHPEMSEYARQNLDRFDLVVVGSDLLVGLDPKIAPFPQGTTWIPSDFVPHKVMAVSTVVGDKNTLEGHRLRHRIWERQDEIPNRQFFLGRFPGAPANPWNNPVLTGPKTPMFDAMFHIAIENVRSKYFFTEKIMDCFVTRTVPIYWGCPNIGDYFDERGILMASNEDEIIFAAKNCDEELYQEMLPYLDLNHRMAQHFLDLGGRLGWLIRERMAFRPLT